MHPKAAFREYYRQFRKAKRHTKGALVQEHAIMVRGRHGRIVGAMKIYFTLDDDRRSCIVLDRVHG